MKKVYRKYGLLCLLILSALSGFAQTGSISGKVTDETDQPVPGASVTIDGTTGGAATDASGSYKISGVSDGRHTLKVQYLGFAEKTADVTVAGNAITANFSLLPASQSLNEVVVIGYGTARKKDLTGSIAVVTSKDFQKGSITSPEQLIAGKVAGVQVTSSGGAPGGGVTIRIRGGASLNSSNDPLIVIDGVPLDNSGIAGLGNPLSALNPNDIESFSILKDASAAAIYGNRASNGVILITTKKGQAGGKLEVNVNSLQSVGVKTGVLDVLNASEYKYAVQEYLKAKPTANPNILNMIGDAHTNWQKEIYQRAFKTDNTVSFSGGVKNLPYRVSVGYLNEDGILKTSNFERFTGALNVNPKFLDNHLSVNLNVKGTIAKTRFANTGAVGAAATFNPTVPVYVTPYDDSKPLSATNYNLGGYFEWVDAKGVPLQLAGKNPVSMLNQEMNTSKANRSIGNLQVDYKFHFLPALKATVVAGYDVSKSDGKDVLLNTLASAYSRKGSTTVYSQNKTNKLLDFYLNYNEEIKSIDSRIDVTAGHSFQKWSITAPATVTPGVGDPQITIDPMPEWALLSYFGRVNYTFKDRYNLTGTLRADESSRFGKNRRGFFPSAAFGWDIKQEAFLKESKTFSQLKLRLGYGKTGQQDITTGVNPYYPYLAKYTLSDESSRYPFGDTFFNMFRPDAYDENITWEKTTTYNVAVDYGFMDGRISGTVEYFLKKTTDLLNLVPLPAGSNFTNTLVTNVGNMESKGLEFTLNLIPIKSKNVNWDLNFNLTALKNKVTKITLAPDNASSPGSPIANSFTGAAIQYNKVGYAPNTYYVRQQLYTDAGVPIEGAYKDFDGDGEIGEADYYHHKSPNPTMLLGMSSNFSYKKWSLGFTLRANLGAYNYNTIAAGSYGDALAFSNFLSNVTSSIKKTRFVANQQYSDIYIENASFLRMDNINLSHNFGRIANAFTLAVSANVQNVFLISSYSGLDPEVTDRGLDVNVYPRPRLYSLGVNLGF